MWFCLNVGVGPNWELVLIGSWYNQEKSDVNIKWISTGKLFSKIAEFIKT